MKAARRRRLAASYVGKVPVRVVAAPRELATFTYSLVWHTRVDASLPHVWFGRAFESWLVA